MRRRVRWASYLPDFVIRWGVKRDARFGRCDEIGWGFWMDVSYEKYCRLEPELTGPCESCDELPPEFPFPNCKCFE